MSQRKVVKTTKNTKTSSASLKNTNFKKLRAKQGFVMSGDRLRLPKIFIILIFVAIFSTVGYWLLQASHASTPLCPAQPAPLATCRPLLGAATYGNPGTPSNPLPASDVTNNDYQFSYLEGLVGPKFKFNVFRDYHCVYGGAACNATLSSITTTEKKYASAGDSININWIPSPSWSSYPVSANSTGAGKTLYNEIVQAANSMKSIAPTPVYLTAWHEMNLHVTDSGVAGCKANGTGGIGTPAQFITAWQNIHDIFKAQGVTNVHWTMNYAGGSHSCLAPLMYPGDKYVDWVTWDTYSRGKTWDQESGVFYNDLLSENGQKNADGQPADFTSKPWGIGEFGTCRQPQGGESEAAYFNSIKAAFQANTYPRLHMYEIYANNAEGNGSGCLTDYDTDPSNPGGNNGPYDPAKQQAVNSLLTTIARSGTNGGPSPTVQLTAPAPNATVSGSTSVSATASVTSGSIVSIELKANGATLKTCSNVSSCSTAWDTTALNNGSYALEASATASDGNAYATTENVTVNNGTAGKPTISSFTANPANPVQGSTTTLSWVTQNISTCSVTPGGPSNTTAKMWSTPVLTTDGVQTYVLTCRGANGGAVATVSKSVNVTVTPVTPPILSVSITSPTNNQTVNGVIGVNVKASSVSSITHSRMVWDGTHLIRNTTKPDNYGWGGRWFTANAPNGYHTVTVTVYNANGQSTSASVRVFVFNIHCWVHFFNVCWM